MDSLIDSTALNSKEGCFSIWGSH